MPAGKKAYGVLDRLDSLSVGMHLLMAVVIGGLATFGVWVLAERLRSASAPVTVTYEVTGTARQADITFEDGDGGPSQVADVVLPLQRKTDDGYGIEITMDRGQVFYISAQNQHGGTITCTVKVDGQVVKTSTSSGAHTSAICSGRAN